MNVTWLLAVLEIVLILHLSVTARTTYSLLHFDCMNSETGTKKKIKRKSMEIRVFHWGNGKILTCSTKNLQNLYSFFS
jgi:hypothetical protein